MNQELMDMVLESDIAEVSKPSGGHFYISNAENLEAFAALVAEAAIAAEREACADIGDRMNPLQDGAIGRAIRARGETK